VSANKNKALKQIYYVQNHCSTRSKRIS